MKSKSKTKSHRFQLHLPSGNRVWADFPLPLRGPEYEFVWQWLRPATDEERRMHCEWKASVLETIAEVTGRKLVLMPINESKQPEAYSKDFQTSHVLPPENRR